MRDPSFLDPFDSIIHVTVEGTDFDVPSNNTVLRLLQYLDFDLYPCRLCWNGDCNNCTFDYMDPHTAQTRSAKGCETLVCDDLQITRIPDSAVWPTKV